jgi:hypothetical protein
VSKIGTKQTKQNSGGLKGSAYNTRPAGSASTKVKLPSKSQPKGR